MSVRIFIFELTILGIRITNNTDTIVNTSQIIHCILKDKIIF